MKALPLCISFLLFLFSSNTILAQTASVAEGCVPLEVTFTPPGGLSGYFWDFKDGSSAEVANPTNIFITPGVYEVELYEGVGGPLVGTVTITVHPKPELMISADPTSGCVPFGVSFSDISNLPPGIVVNNYQWVFGDGGSGTGNPTGHVYTMPGTYTVGLNIETNFPSCDVTEIFPDLIEVSSIPVANFVTIPNPAISCVAPFTVNFNNLTNNPENFTFEWNFGNGETSTLADPPGQTYDEGQYIVTLIVTDAVGCSRTITRPVSVGTPEANFSVPDTVCLDQSVTMVNLSSTGNYIWNFGSDAEPPFSSVAQPTVTFTAPGEQSITLTVSTGSCVHDTTIMVFVDSVDASFTADPTYTCEGRLITNYFPNSTVATQFFWLFPDFDISTEQFPTDTIYYPTDSFTINSQTLYTVFLTATNPSGCTATYEYEFVDTIHRPNSLFITDVADGCVPLEVEFSDESTSNEDIIEWEWHFGDGTVQTYDNGFSFTHTYNNTGVFESYLIITNEAGCKDTSYLIPIRVGDLIMPDFTVDQTEVCPGDTVNFTNLTNDPRIDTWHFETDNGRSFHCYQAPQLSWTFDTETGPMDVSLTVGYNGCFTTHTIEDMILVKGPIAQIDYLVECPTPYDFMFRDSSHDATSVLWDFGDGMTSTDGDLTHTYDTTGNYTVILTAENDSSGCPASKDTATVYVRDITAVFELDSLICYGSTEILNGSASQDVQNDCWRGFTWFTTFNRPITTQDVAIPLVFGDSGMHTVTLVTRDINGCSDTLSQDVAVFATRPEFTVDKTLICFPTEVNFTNLTTADTTIAGWEWYFGDGNTSTGQHPSHIYNSTLSSGDSIVARLVTRDTLGCQYSTEQTIYVYKPESQITATPPNLCAGAEVDFSATDFTEQGSNLSFLWDFGNGDFGNDQLETITYNDEGTFEVQMIYEEIATGCKDSTTTVINVQGYPMADFNTSVDNEPIVCYPENIFFMDNSTSNFPLTYSWNFGNGQTGSGSTTATSFGKGTFEISLIVSTSYGCRDTITETITLIGPEGDFVMDQAIICKGDVITFNLIDTVDVNSFSWDFGDGTGADDIDPVSHQYNFLPPGSTTVVKLVLRGLNDACAIAVEQPIEIINVLADFFANDGIDTMLCVGEVPFTNQSVNADIFNWDFGDGSTSMENSPVHDYTMPGTYTILLAIESAALGCTDTLTREVIITPLPTVEFPGDTICAGEPVILSAVVSDTNVTYVWLPSNVLDNNTLANPTATLNSSTTFNVEVTDENECVGSTSGTVEVLPEHFGYSWDTIIGIGNPVTLPFIYDSDLYTYSWSPTVGLSCLDCSNPVVTPEESTTYIVTVEDIFGCFSVTYNFNVEVVSEEIAVPNVFTPDGDGNNDFFNYFLGEGASDHASLLKFKVFNRWGELVYDNDSPGQGWDGTYKDELAPSDVYIYILEVQFITGKLAALKGDVTLLR